MKILFINPPCRSPNLTPLGIGYIASVLRNRGHRVSVLDINAYQHSKAEVENSIKELDYDCVGIGGLTTTYKYVKWLSDLIKSSRPQVPIVAGNMVATAHPQLLLAS